MPSFVVQQALPLKLQPPTNFAAAEAELNGISTIILLLSILLKYCCLAFIVAGGQLFFISGLISLPFKTTNPSLVIIPLALYLPLNENLIVCL